MKSLDFATNIYSPRRGFRLTDYCNQRAISSAEPVAMDLFSKYGLWAQEQLVPHLEQVEVTRLASDGSLFEVGLANGEKLSARRVVMATGLAFFSYLPEVLPGLPPDLVTHTCQREYGRFRDRGVAVLGAGQSALEAAVLLHEAGARQKLLSRCDGASFAPPPPPRRPLHRRVLHPVSVLGPSRSSIEALRGLASRIRRIETSPKLSMHFESSLAGSTLIPMLPVCRLAARTGDAARACAAAWRTGGLADVKQLVTEAAYWRLHPRVRCWRVELPRQEKIDEAFDRRFGVDTAGEVLLSSIGLADPEVQRGHSLYRSVWTSVFQEAVGRLPIAFDRFTFIDYGSGKGKALLLAADYPFEEIIGIEFARPLHEIATRNLQTYASVTKRCKTVRSECADALQFEPPARPLVCFFFNPFDDATMDAVIVRLVDSVRRNPRDVFVVYCNMRDVREHRDAFRRRTGLRLVVERPRFLALRVAPTSGPLG